MSTFGGPGIVIGSNLVFSLDAGNIKSYPGSGITWYDKSGNNFNGTLCNLITYDSSKFGNLVFNGTSSMITIPNTTRLIWSASGVVGNSNMSIDIWVKTTDLGGYIYSKPWNGSGQYNIQLSHNGFRLMCGASGTTISDLAFTSIATGNWVNIVFWMSSTQQGCYINGTQSSTTISHGLSGDVPTSGNSSEKTALMTLYPYGEGWGGNSGFSITGNLSICRVYDRVLTASEVLQNYNSTQTRFN